MKKKSAQSQSVPQKENGPNIISIIGLFGIIISMLLALVVIVMPLSKPRHEVATVIFAGDVDNFPVKSMTNTIHSAGFEIEISNGEIDIDEGESYIIVGVGENSFDYVTSYRDSSSVLGFVVLCPSFPDGSKVSGMNSVYPAKDIAIFAGNDDASTVSDIKDARLIYERLSGDDTVYGTPVKRGMMFPSKVFVNNNQNRWLSLSYFNFNSGRDMLYSPLFQNELAGYLSTMYDADGNASFGRINIWFGLTIVSVMLFVSFFCIYLAGVPVVKKNRTVDMGNNLLRNSFLAFIPAIYSVELSVIIGDMKANSILVAGIIALIDLIVFAIASYIGGKARTIIVLLTLLVSFIALDIGLFAKNEQIVSYALAVFTMLLASYAFSFPSSRHGTNPIFTGLVHGITAFMVLLVIL